MRRTRRNGWMTIAVAALAAFLVGRTALAEDAASAQALSERLESLDQRQRILERNWELAREDAETKARQAVSVSAGKDGLLLKTADGAYGLKIGGYFQADGRFFFDDARIPLANTLLVRRAFLTFDGNAGRNVTFRVQTDFGEGKAVLQDAYFDYRFTPAARVRVGKTKAPVGLERLQSATDARFAELGFTTSLVPNRDIGIQLLGDLAGDRVSYAAGVFNGVQDGGSSDGDANDEKDYVARVFAHPFRGSDIEVLEGLGLGVAGTYGLQSGSVDTAKKSLNANLPTFKTAGQQTFFSYLSDTANYSVDNTVVAAGERIRIAPQGYYYHRSLGLIGEYVRSRQKVRRNGAVDTLADTAWQVEGSWVLTGENASWRRVVPARPFDPAKGGLGALEIAGRYGELRVDPATFPTFADIRRSAERARRFGAALNWYLTTNVKIAASYEQTEFEGGARNGNAAVDREKEKVLFSRFQLAY